MNKRTTSLLTKFGNPAKDQKVVEFHDGTNYVSQFYSYDTLIAERINGNLILSSYHDYSATTNFYLNQFAGNGKPERRKAINAGTLKVVETTRDTKRLV